MMNLFRPRTGWFVTVTLMALLASIPAGAQDAPGASMDHSHLPIAVPVGTPPPQLSLTLHPDAMSGYNLQLNLRHFEQGPPPPETTSMAALMTASVHPDSGFVEGHAHLYINGEKIRRVYGQWTHLPADLLRPGINQVTVTLNNHGHLYWTVDKRQVLATLFIDPEQKAPVIHRFESFAAR